MTKMNGIKGAGLGFRREFMNDINTLNFKPNWFEITPENWIYMPYEYRELFEQTMEQFPIVAHGLSLSIGSLDPLDMNFLKDIKDFLDRFKIKHYSEHLSFSNFLGAQTYELLPVPMTPKMVEHISDKIKKVQDYLGRPLILENASYYYIPYSEMLEVDFINSVLEKSDSQMLLDVNNVFVNSVNHQFYAKKFIKDLNLDRVAYIHIAGHLEYPEEKLLLDTHGEKVNKQVWKLLDYTLNLIDVPVMIERDNNIPPLKKLIKEYDQLDTMLRAKNAK